MVNLLNLIQLKIILVFPYTDNRNNKFEISLDVFAGDAVLNIESKLDSYTYKYIFFGSSEKYIFEYKDQGN